MVIKVLNSKLGITLRVSVTSASILTAKRTIRPREPYTKIHKHVYADVTETRNVIPSLKF